MNLVGIRPDCSKSEYIFECFVSCLKIRFCRKVGRLQAGRGHGRSLVVGRGVDGHPTDADVEGLLLTLRVFQTAPKVFLPSPTRQHDLGGAGRTLTI